MELPEPSTTGGCSTRLYRSNQRDELATDAIEPLIELPDLQLFEILHHMTFATIAAFCVITSVFAMAFSSDG